MSNWEEIEKQIKEYAKEYVAECENGCDSPYDSDATLANIKGIVEAMESQIPKECSHGVSLTEGCGQCKAELTIAENQQQRCSFCGKDCWEHWVGTGVCGDCHIEIVGEKAPENERIEQLSERIAQLEIAAGNAQLELAQLHLNLANFMAKCEENGKKREERIKRLETRVDFITECSRIAVPKADAAEARLRVLEDAVKGLASQLMKGH